MNDDIVRKHAGAFRWEGVEVLAYKQEGTAPFRDVTRQVLFDDASLAAQLRYFEVAPGGWTTLERHDHVHNVMVIHGKGRCLVGEEAFELAENDLVRVPPMTWHQFRADGDSPLGFLCLVSRERDRPQLPTAEEFERMRRMVEDMLFIARAEEAAAAISREGVDLRTVCDALAEFHALTAEEVRVRIEVSGRGVVSADANLVRRAVSNLLSNAVRHATPGSVVRLTIRSANTGPITVEVANAGPGIPPELQQTVFERFVRADTSRRRPHDGVGLGLGLSIVRSIMRLHGGSVELESGPQRDTVFRLIFTGR